MTTWETASWLFITMIILACIFLAVAALFSTIGANELPHSSTAYTNMIIATILLWSSLLALIAALIVASMSRSKSTRIMIVFLLVTVASLIFIGGVLLALVFSEIFSLPNLEFAYWTSVIGMVLAFLVFGMIVIAIYAYLDSGCDRIISNYYIPDQNVF